MQSSLSSTSCNGREGLADEVSFAMAANRSGSRSSVYQQLADPSISTLQPDF